YTTAFPLHTLVSIQTIYSKLPNLEAERKQLKKLINYFSTQIHHSALPIKTSSSAIQSIAVNDSVEVVKISQHLQAAGLDVRAIRQPTVRPGCECLRVCLHSINTEKEIDILVMA